MSQILILYPKEFKSITKFNRKVLKITANMSDYSVVYLNDHNHLIRDFLALSDQKHCTVQTDDWTKENITHAIIFDDGEVFPEEIEKIVAKNIPIRLIRIKITRVVNIKKDIQYAKIKSNSDYEYIGRGSYWGNPYSMYAEGDSREEVIRKFKYDFEYEKFPNKEKSEVYKLAGKRLGCFCKPEACHGDVLADFLNEWDDGN